MGTLAQSFSECHTLDVHLDPTEQLAKCINLKINSSEIITLKQDLATRALPVHSQVSGSVTVS